jgi:hypothetical protein
VELLSRRLRTNPHARIHWPSTDDEKAYLADLVYQRDRRNLVYDIIGFTDGVSLRVECASDPVSQATFYNGYHHDTMIKYYVLLQLVRSYLPMLITLGHGMTPKLQQL